MRLLCILGAAVALAGRTAADAAVATKPALPPPTTIRGFPNCGPRPSTKGVPPRAPDPVLCANVTELPAGGGYISVAWTGVSDPSRKDEVALYYADAVPSLGDHLAAGVPPEKAAALKAVLGPAPGPPIKSLPAAGVGDAADGVGSAHLSTGAGSVTFAVSNLRWPVVVALQTVKWNRLAVEALSGPITFAHPDAPQQVLVGGLGPRPGTATVRWSTAGGGGGRAAPPSPRLRWGWAPGKLTAGDVPAATFSYARDDMCGGDAVAGFSSPGALHSAVVDWAGHAGAAAPAPATGPGRRVFYELYDAADKATPTFTGSFLPLTPDRPKARIAFAADVGQGEPDGSTRPLGWTYPASLNTSRALAAQVDPSGYAATSIIVGGDVSYANGHAPTWDAFFNQFQGAFAGAPTVFATGNHELLWSTSATGDRYGNATDSGGECGVPFAVRTGGGSGAPGGGGDGGGGDNDGSGRSNPAWFSYDDGPVHVQVYSTEHPFGQGTPQYAWIAQDLQAVDRSVTPWLVVVGHRPPYLASAYPGGGNASDAAVALDLATHLEPLWLGAGVDLTLAGHHHSYQRTCAMAGRGRCADGRSAAGAAGYNETVGGAPIPSLDDLAAVLRLPRPANGGPVHVVAGIGGGELTDNAMPWPSPGGWDALAFQHGYARLSADADSLALTAVRSLDGAVLDAFELRKSEPGVVRTLGGVGVTAAPDVAAASVGGAGGAK